MSNQINRPIFVQVGRKRYQVRSLAAASSMFVEARDRSGVGASDIPGAEIVDECVTFIAWVSYNGRVWADHDGNRLLCEAAA